MTLQPHFDCVIVKGDNIHEVNLFTVIILHCLIMLITVFPVSTIMPKHVRISKQ